jgi:putative hydrolase of the HAD superfamily
VRSRLLVFDGDDTLWWTEQLYDDARREAARIVSDAGLDATLWEEIERSIDVDNVARYGLGRERFPTSCVEAYDQTARLAGVAADPTARSAIWDAADSVFARAAPLVDGTYEVIKDLAEIATVALLTKGDPAVQRQRLESSGLSPLFDAIVIVNDKSPDAFRSLVDTHRARPQESWSVGNSWRSDIEPALAIGMRAIWIDAHVWEYERQHPSKVRHEALHVAKTLREVPGIVRSWIQSLPTTRGASDAGLDT